MSDTDRMQRWRQQQRDAGLVPLTIWVSPATKARYQDLALTLRSSVSALAQQALDAYRPGTAVTDTVTATEQIRTLIQAELAAQMPALVEAALAQRTPSAVPVSATESVISTDTLTDTVTETVPETSARPARPTRMAHVQALAQLRREHPTLSLDQLAQLAFDQGVYRAQSTQGVAVPVNRGTLRRWLAQAREAEAVGDE